MLACAECSRQFRSTIMIPGSTHTRLKVGLGFALLVCATAAGFLKFSAPTEAGGLKRGAARISGAPALALNEPLALSSAITARRAPDNSRIINIQDGHDTVTANFANRLAVAGVDMSS